MVIRNPKTEEKALAGRKVMHFASDPKLCVLNRSFGNPMNLVSFNFGHEF